MIDETIAKVEEEVAAAHEAVLGVVSTNEGVGTEIGASIDASKVIKVEDADEG